VVWHHSLLLMNSFNITEAAVFSCRLCFLRAFPFISLIKIDLDTQGDIWSKVLVKLIFGGTELKVKVTDVKTTQCKSLLLISLVKVKMVFGGTELKVKCTDIKTIQRKLPLYTFLIIVIIVA